MPSVGTRPERWQSTRPCGPSRSTGIAPSGVLTSAPRSRDAGRRCWRPADRDLLRHLLIADERVRLVPAARASRPIDGDEGSPDGPVGRARTRIVHPVRLQRAILLTDLVDLARVGRAFSKRDRLEQLQGRTQQGVTGSGAVHQAKAGLATTRPDAHVRGASYSTRVRASAMPRRTRASSRRFLGTTGPAPRSPRPPRGGTIRRARRGASAVFFRLT